MFENNSIVLSDLGGLSKPAEALINRLSEAMGGIAKPWQIKRVAKAEAEAQKIAALARIEITEMEERALQRMIKEQTRDQENIENVTRKAIPHLKENSKPADLEEDFIRLFFDKVRLISDEEMQEVWAKVLAGEANRKGSFSPTTLRIISEIDKKIASDFELVWKDSVGVAVNNDPKYQRGEWYSRRNRLFEAGLISNKVTAQYLPEPREDGTRIWTPFETKNIYVSIFFEDRCLAKWNHIEFTKAGIEIGRILETPNYVENMREAAKSIIGPGITKILLITDKHSELLFESG